MKFIKKIIVILSLFIKYIIWAIRVVLIVTYNRTGQIIGYKRTYWIEYFEPFIPSCIGQWYNKRNNVI